jgi:hypothetical protein
MKGRRSDAGDAPRAMAAQRKILACVDKYAAQDFPIMYDRRTGARIPSALAGCSWLATPARAFSTQAQAETYGEEKSAMPRITILIVLALLAQTTLAAACPRHKTTTCTSMTNVAGTTKTVCRQS